MGVCVLDVGSARAKLTIATGPPGAVQFQTISRDIFLLGGGAAAPDVEAISSALMELIDTARSEGCTSLVAYGTHALRAGITSPAVRSAVERALGKVPILSPHAEAAAFLESIRIVGALTGETAAIDIGGGSVQIVWGPEPDSFGSVPIGTFALEAQFQEPREKPLRPGTSRFGELEQFVQQSLSETIPRHLSCETLIIGSNTMGDFFGSALTAIGESPHQDALGASFTAHQLHVLSSAVLGREYESLGYLFPSNPKFMYGADKLLIILKIAAELLKPSVLIGTNLSTSKGIAYVTLLQPDRLRSYGLELSLL